MRHFFKRKFGGFKKKQYLCTRKGIKYDQKRTIYHLQSGRE